MHVYVYYGVSVGYGEAGLAGMPAGYWAGSDGVSVCSGKAIDALLRA